MAADLTSGREPPEGERKNRARVQPGQIYRDEREQLWVEECLHRYRTRRARDRAGKRQQNKLRSRDFLKF